LEHASISPYADICPLQMRFIVKDGMFDRGWFPRLEEGNLLKGLESFLQDLFDPGNIFGNWFGGGDSQTEVIPNGFHRIAHFPPGQFIGVPLTLIPAEENSDRRYSPTGGWIIWVSGPASPPSACSYYGAALNARMTLTHVAPVSVATIGGILPRLTAFETV
jgi:hypothetical protein